MRLLLYEMTRVRRDGNFHVKQRWNVLHIIARFCWYPTRILSDIEFSSDKEDLKCAKQATTHDESKSSLLTLVHMHYQDQLTKHAMHASGLGEALLSQMLFAQFLFHCQPLVGIEPRAILDRNPMPLSCAFGHRHLDMTHDTAKFCRLYGVVRNWTAILGYIAKALQITWPTKF